MTDVDIIAFIGTAPQTAESVRRHFRVESSRGVLLRLTKAGAITKAIVKTRRHRMGLGIYTLPAPLAASRAAIEARALLEDGEQRFQPYEDRVRA